MNTQAAQVVSLATTPLDEAVTVAVKTLTAGGVVIYPTETVYGLAVDATDSAAVSTLLAIKNRPVGKPISVLVADEASAEAAVTLNPSTRETMRSLLPGPYTLVLPSKTFVDARLVSEMGNLGIRISSHSFAQELARQFSKPLTATSANAAGAARPYTIKGALESFSDEARSKIDLIIDAGELPKAEPSTVLDLTGTSQRFIRLGDTTLGSERVVVDTPEQMIALAKRLTESLLHGLAYHPIFILLEGDLGAGKTQFTKGIAEAMQVTATVTSPSYTLVKEYGSLIHMDLWRASSATAQEIGLPEYAKPGNIIAIEWPTPVEGWLAEEKRYGLRVQISGEVGRNVVISPL